MSAEVTIERMAHGGDGVGYIEGKICFVPYALVGDKVSVEITEDGKRFSRAKIIEVLEASPHRIETNCPAFGTCGGCGWLHFAYPAQMEWKQKIIEECFRRLGKIEVSVDGIGDPDLHTGYRTRATFRGADGKRGFYAPQSHDVIDLEECPLCDPAVNTALKTIRETGVEGDVEVVVNPEGDEVFIWTDEPNDPLSQAFPIVESLGFGDTRSNFFFDDTPVVNGTFNQSSLKLNRILVDHVHSLLESVETILDLYCGSGNLTMALSDRAKVIGLDRDGPSIKAADTANRGEFYIGKQRDFHDFIHRQAWDAIVLDPPRVGAKNIMKSLSESKAKKIIYVSCDPATLARDSAVLVAAGWVITNVTAVDIFPNTSHVETVCVLEPGE
jgi:23S rRNA (uracil1939-C5)-methyltransferase